MLERNPLNDYRIQSYYQRNIGTRFEPKLRRLLDTQSKSEIEKTMVQIGLPVFKSLFLATSDFLENPTNYCRQLQSKMFFVEIESSTSSEKKRDFNLTLDQVINFTSNHRSLDRMILKENYYNIFSGTIVIREDKKDIYIEMVNGALTKLLHNGEVDYTITSDDFLHTLKYNFQDVGIKQIVIKTLQHIPSPDLINEPMNFSREFLPGYYEFIIVDKEDGYGLQPIFFDYNNNSVFTDVFRTDIIDLK